MQTLDENTEFTTITATDLRNNSPDLLERVALLKEVVIVEKHKKPKAVIIPYEAFVSQDHFLFSDSDRDVFMKALSSPPKPNTALKRAMKKALKA